MQYVACFFIISVLMCTFFYEYVFMYIKMLLMKNNVIELMASMSSYGYVLNTCV